MAWPCTVIPSASRHTGCSVTNSSDTRAGGSADWGSLCHREVSEQILLATQAKFAGWFRWEWEAIPIQIRLRGAGEIDPPKGGAGTSEEGKGHQARKPINILPVALGKTPWKTPVCSLSPFDSFLIKSLLCCIPLPPFPPQCFNHRGHSLKFRSTWH